MIIINGHIKVPSRFDEISLRKGIEIMSTIECTETLSIEDMMMIIHIASGIPLNKIVKWDHNGIRETVNHMSFAKGIVYARHYKSFRLNGTLYGLTNMSQLTVKEMAQVDYYLNEGDTPYDYLPQILSTLFRPIKRTKNRTLKHILNNIINKCVYKGLVPLVFDSYEIETLSDDDYPIDDFLKLDFSFGYSVLAMIRSFKESLAEEYNLLFKKHQLEDGEAPEEIEVNKGYMEFEDIWTWYHYIATVSSDLFEREAWWNRRLTHFLKYLTYLKQFNLYNKTQNG